MKVAIVGGGISGLSAAYFLRKFSRENNIDIELTLFEKSNRVGGVINTFKSNEYILENGPDMFITNKPWAIELVKELGLEDELQPTNEKNRAVHVYFNNKLNKLPDGFCMIAPTNIKSFIASDFFSWKAKLRILFEALIPRKITEDESLYSFAMRRFGEELYHKAAEPLISGIYTADPKKLSLRSTMPQFLDMEKNDGSIVVSLLKSTFSENIKQSGARYNLFYSFKNGMSLLVDKLIENIRFDNLILNQEVNSISKENGLYSVKTDEKQESFDAVVLSTSSFVSSKLISDIDSELSEKLSKFDYASSVVVNLVFNKSDFYNFPKGFGIVVPSSENLNIIACSVYSEKFTNRVDQDKLVLRCFLGGKLNEGVLEFNDKQLLEIVEHELKKLFNLNNFTSDYQIVRYPKSMPQYEVGHSVRIKEVIDMMSNHTSLGLCGSMYHGVGIPDCINSGEIAAKKVIKDLGLSVKES